MVLLNGFANVTVAPQRWLPVTPLLEAGVPFDRVGASFEIVHDSVPMSMELHMILEFVATSIVSGYE